MKDVTLWRSNEDGKARMIEWSDRDHPTEEEMMPEWHRFIVYTTMPTDWVEYVKNKTEDEVNVILSWFVP